MFEICCLLISIAGFTVAYRWRDVGQVSRHGVHSPCWSCGNRSRSRRRAPSDIECCDECWRTMKTHDKLELMIAIRDRSDGGVLAEAADLINRTAVDPHRYENTSHDGESA